MECNPSSSAVMQIREERGGSVALHLQHMVACSIDPLHLSSDLHDAAERCAQEFVRGLLTLPNESLADGMIVALPGESKIRQITFPRTHPLPAEKTKTRWERFAQDRGIRKRKRSRLVYDDVTKDWVPRWGARGVQSIRKDATTVIEHKGVILPRRDVAKLRRKSGTRQPGVGATDAIVGGRRSRPMPISFDCPFSGASKSKQEMKAKQQLRELRNQLERYGGKKGARSLIAGDNEGSSAGVAVLSARGRCHKRRKEQLQELMCRAQKSTASSGLFDERASGEVSQKQRKRQKARATSLREETEAYKQQLRHLTGGK